MRTANQKWKLSSALKNMNDNNHQQQLQIENNQLKIPTLSIINIDSFAHQPLKKSQRSRKKVMFCTLTGPHKKKQTNPLKQFFESKAIKILLQQKSKSKSISERNKPLLGKSATQFSQRLISTHKVVKRSSQQSIQVSNEIRSRIDSADHSEVQSYKKNSSFNLYKANEILIKQDSHLKVQNGRICNLGQVAHQNSKTFTQPSVFIDNDSIMMQKLVKWQKEEAILKFKKSLKNKQSRKNIHRVLRQTSQTTSKYKTKMKHLQISKDVLQASGITQIQNLSTLNYGLTKSNIKHFCLSNLKRFNSPFLDPQRDLKIQAKAAEIADVLSKKTQESAIRNIYKNKAIGQKSKAYNTQSCFDIKQYKFRTIDSSYVKKRWRSSKQKQICNFSVDKQRTISADKERTNLFRQLTPWHEDGVE